MAKKKAAKKPKEKPSVRDGAVVMRKLRPFWNEFERRGIIDQIWELSLKDGDGISGSRGHCRVRIALNDNMVWEQWFVSKSINVEKVVDCMCADVARFAGID